ncbi:50S ribosomal protein L15 [Cellulomonas sp. Marseille-Q8402]
MAEKKADKVEETAAAAPKATKAKASKAEATTESAAAEKPAAKKPATRTTKAKAETAAAAEEKPAAKAKAPAAKAPAKASAKAEPVETGAGGTLKVHHLRPAPGAKTAKTRVGRGEASKGKTAGRGTKGTKARYQVPTRFEGGQMPLHMRLPKLRGFKNPFRVEYQVVNLDKLSALYPDGGDVTVADLVAKGAVRKGAPVKVLGTGEITVKLSVAVDAYSGSAKEKIVAAGGSVAQD